MGPLNSHKKFQPSSASQLVSQSALKFLLSATYGQQLEVAKNSKNQNLIMQTHCSE